MKPSEYQKEFDDELAALDAEWKSWKNERPYRWSNYCWWAGLLLIFPIPLACTLIYGLHDLHADMATIFGALMMWPHLIVILSQTIKKKRQLAKLRLRIEIDERVRNEILRYFAPETYKKMRSRRNFMAVLDKRPEGKKE